MRWHKIILEIDRYVAKEGRQMPTTGNTLTAAATYQETQANGYSLDELVRLSIAGLIGMYDIDRKLFRFRYRKVGDVVFKVDEVLPIRYSIIALLGLKRFTDQTGERLVDIEGAVRSLVEKAAGFNSIGDLGLLLWLCALVAEDEFVRLYTASDIPSAIERCKEGQVGLTTELSWLLTGLTYFYQAKGARLQGIEETIMSLYGTIKGNYGGYGIFSHQKPCGFILGRRARIGCFADQVYPIYAFSLFGKAFGNVEALDIAEATANRICELQGPLGQWWWHYDASAGNVVGRYPVYSVHQDGMAPMALFALGNATGRNYNASIYKGLSWITGNNELGINMVDTEYNAIWRNLHRPRVAKYAELAGTSITGTTASGQPKDLRVLNECWSYHLGWLLYAFAGA